MVIAGVDPATGQPTGWTIAETSAGELDRICVAAGDAATEVASRSRVERAGWLRAIAAELESRRASLVAVADAETGLGEVRLNGELTRTCYQARAFADVVDEGSYLEAIIDHAGDTAMGPRPDLRRMLVPLGPVGVFAASNFPFAFSVPGGDTMSAIAAGCPVVVKAHPSHPQTSAELGEAILVALGRAGAPRASFAVVHGMDAGSALMVHPAIRAVGFTGSGAGGRALNALAAERAEPIPFYGELSGINPLVVTLNAATERASQIAVGLVDSINLGGGQFCTKPGLVFVPDGSAGDELVAQVEQLGAGRAAAVALNAGIADAYVRRLSELDAAGAKPLLRGAALDLPGFRMSPAVATVSAEQAVGTVAEEIFGPSVVVARYADESALFAALGRLPGSLTATVHAADEDPLAEQVALALVAKAGRVVWNGFPTGVAVAEAMHHGGPAPSTTNSLHTSVGATAIRRFLRPVSWQGAPERSLPSELRDGPAPVPRRVDGRWELP